MAVRGGLRWRVGSVPGSPFVVAGLAMAACWLARPAPDGGQLATTSSPTVAIGSDPRVAAPSLASQPLAVTPPAQPPAPHPQQTQPDQTGISDLSRTGMPPLLAVAAAMGACGAVLAANRLWRRSLRQQYTAMAAVQGVREVPRTEYIAADTLFVSEPEPQYFGNPPNDPRNARWSHPNWLQSRFHFDFAEYRSRDRSRFGVLRVLNDDLVQPQRGFGAHPHRDMEIVTFVVEGQITHQDSTGTKETLGPGSVQFMTAGRGIVHSEHNLGDVPLRLLQLWILPRTAGLTPNYGSYHATPSPNTDGWRHLVSDMQSSDKTPVKVQQDVNLFVCDTTGPQRLSLRAGRQAYVVCVTGQSAVEVAAPTGSSASHRLLQHDALRLYGPAEVDVAPESSASLLVVEMKQA
eukprot:EG_transcript_11892